MCSMPLEPVGLLAGEAANASVLDRLAVKIAAPEAPMIWRNVRRENMSGAYVAEINATLLGDDAGVTRRPILGQLPSASK
jgi:hypothetical protein